MTQYPETDDPRDAEPEAASADVEGHMFIPPDERGGGHPSPRPQGGRVAENDG